MVISNNFNEGALGTTTPTFLVWSCYNHVHVLKDGSMIIYFNTDIVLSDIESTIRDASITIKQSTIDHSTLEARPINYEKLSQNKNFREVEPPKMNINFNKGDSTP